MVAREEALSLIAEMEGMPAVRQLEVGEIEVKKDPALMEWLDRLSREHPAFQGIPNGFGVNFSRSPDTGTWQSQAAACATYDGRSLAAR